MSMEEQELDRIHRYLMLEMDARERAAFEQECAQDAALRQAVETERALLTAIRLDARMQVKKLLQSTPLTEDKPVRPLWRRPMAWASVAAALLLITTLTMFWPTSSSTWYAEPKEEWMLAGTRSSLSHADSLLNAGAGLYGRREYAAALDAYRLAAQADSTQPHAHFAAAHCLWHLDRFAEAAAEFEASSGLCAPEEELYAQAVWYQALSLMQTGDNARAATLLRDLRAAHVGTLEPALSEKVDQLLEELEGE